MAGARVTGLRDDSKRLSALRERDEAGRLAQEYWATAEPPLTRGTASVAPTPGTASPGAAGTL